MYLNRLPQTSHSRARTERGSPWDLFRCSICWNVRVQSIWDIKSHYPAVFPTWIVHRWKVSSGEFVVECWYKLSTLLSLTTRKVNFQGTLEQKMDETLEPDLRRSRLTIQRHKISHWPYQLPNIILQAKQFSRMHISTDLLFVDHNCKISNLVHCFVQLLVFDVILFRPPRCTDLEGD